MEKRVLPALIVLSLLFASCTLCAEDIFIEAEGFWDLGGWVVDQQFMDVMGSPYLLAHGLGEPVADATTTVDLPAAGKYRVWVRTRDWVGPWNAPGQPGKFQVLIDGKPLETTFGTEGAEWHWQDGGTVQIEQRKVQVTLHDLTGFEGRCDAIVLTTEAEAPPNEADALRSFRRKALDVPDKPADVGTFDLVVVGGGMAGTCAAISAARLGLSVALIQDRPVLGGNNSSEVRVWLGGETNYEPYPRIGDIVKELDPKRRAHYGPENVAEIYEDCNKLAVVRAEKNISLFVNMHAFAVEKDRNAIKAVVGKNTTYSTEHRFAGRLFADCTGDGTIGFLAGADFEMTTDGHMGPSNLWNVVDTGSPQQFPRCPWAIDLSDKPFPGRGDNTSVYGQKGLEALGGWYWESGFFYDPLEKGEYVRDLNLRAMYGAWDALKNVDGVYSNHKLAWAAFIAGKRESRRLMGDIVLTKDDLLRGRQYDDGCVPTSWDMDLHLPAPQYKDEHGKDAFISKDYHTQYKRPYWIPYRCLYSRNISNLFMAGRDISVTHEALGSVRVMRTGGMMGEVVGMAAAVCQRHKCTPREVYEKHLSELRAFMRAGAGRQAGSKAEEVLFDFGAGYDGDVVSANNAKAAVTAEGALLVETECNNWPGVNLRCREGAWDLSGFAHIKMEVKNAGERDIRVYCKLTSAGEKESNITESAGLGPGEKKTLAIWFHPTRFIFDRPMQLVGMRTAPGDRGTLDTSKVSKLFVFLNEWSKPARFEIDNVRAAGQVKIYDADTFLPFIDCFGQFAQGEWPGKVRSVPDLARRYAAELNDLTINPGPGDWDDFGGYAQGPKLASTGFFRVEKYNGKWWLVDPEGHLFWSHGIDCVRARSETPVTNRERYFAWLPNDDSPFAQFYGKATWAPHGYYKDHSPYRTFDFAAANLLNKYGQGWQQTFAEVTHRRLGSWGLNTIGNWSEQEMYLLRRTPYVATVSAGGRTIEGSEGYWGKFYDVFDDSFGKSLQERLSSHKGTTAGDKWCIGYFVDNELAWGDETSLAVAALVSPADQLAKKVFVDNLRTRYRSVEKLNAAWGTSYGDWNSVLSCRDKPDVNKAREDLRAFYTKTAETYFRIVREEVKKIAPNQLYLGCRFAWGNDLAAKAGAKFCDVISYNFYQYDIGNRRLPDNIDKPIIIGEFHFGALDRGMFHPGLCPTADQNDRAFAYRSYVQSALRNPYIVGTHWFQYKDQATTGRGDGENYQIGFLDIADTPYLETVSAARSIGEALYKYRLRE